LADDLKHIYRDRWVRFHACRQVPAIIEDGNVLWGITTTAPSRGCGPGRRRRDRIRSAVRESLQSLRWQQRIGGRAPYEALRRILPVADATLATLHSGR
jgi:hypothetical protein